MASQRIDRGPTAVTVASNIQRVMRARGLTYEGLSRALADVGRPILATGLVKIVNGTRRVDADDLMALAVALRVNPSTLLLPSTAGSDGTYDITGAAGVDAHVAWDWADGRSPLFDPDGDESDLDFQLHARPTGRRSMRYLPGRNQGEGSSIEFFDRIYPDGLDVGSSVGRRRPPFPGEDRQPWHQRPGRLDRETGAVVWRDEHEEE
jgi:Cro/C1-type HTH DNA-binding domain